MLDNERLKEIIREIYGDAKLAEPEDELKETCKSLRITEEEANEIGCPSMADWEAEYEDDGNSFISDKEKMSDFILISKKEFLESYSYLEQKDYEATIKDIVKRLDLDIVGDLIDDAKNLEGKEVGTIVLSQMMVEWLSGKESL